MARGKKNKKNTKGLQSTPVALLCDKRVLCDKPRARVI